MIAAIHLPYFPTLFVLCGGLFAGGVWAGWEIRGARDEQIGGNAVACSGGES